MLYACWSSRTVLELEVEPARGQGELRPVDSCMVKLMQPERKK